MTKSTKHMARAKVLEARREDNAEQAAREAHIVEQMAGLLTELDALGDLDSRTQDKVAELEAKTSERIAALQQELVQRIDKVREQARQKAASHEAAAGAALRALRAQKESVARISAQTGQSQTRLRALLKAEAVTVEAPCAESAADDTALEVMPHEGAPGTKAPPEQRDNIEQPVPELSPVG